MAGCALSACPPSQIPNDECWWEEEAGNKEGRKAHWDDGLMRKDDAGTAKHTTARPKGKSGAVATGIEKWQQS